MNENKCFLKDQIDSLFDLLPIQLENSKKTIEENVHKEDFMHFRHVYIVASGDSYMAALAGQRAFEKYANKYAVHYHAVKAMEISRFNEFTDRDLNEQTLVIVISKSGIGSRVIEVLERVNALNMTSMVITDSIDSEAVELAKYRLYTDTPKFTNDRPALRSYFAAMVTLYLLAARFSEMYGNSMNMETMSKNIYDYMMSYKDKIAVYDEQMMELAEKYKHANSITFVGDSDEQSSCNFAVSKVIEVTGIHSKSDDSEEYGHINYFNHYVATNPVFFIANSLNSNMSRVLETIKQSIAVGRPTYLMMNENSEVEDIEGLNKIVLPPVQDDVLQPLGSYIPATILANHISDLLDEPLFRGNIYPDGFNTIRNSKIVVYGEDGNEIIS